MAQLRYAGMMETIRIRKLGYPVRYVVKDFYNRFRCLKTVTGVTGTKFIEENRFSNSKMIRKSAQPF